MFIATLSAAATLLAQGVSCPVMGGAAVSAEFTEYNGAKFAYCCPGCKGGFEAEPAKFLQNAGKGKVVGVFLFDPVSRQRLQPEKAKGGSSDYAGLRFHFETAQNKAVFDADPKKFGTLPKKEVLECPVKGAKVSAYSKASGYADFEGVRYYFCCPGCDAPFANDPAKHAQKLAAQAKAPVAIPGKA